MLCTVVVGRAHESTVQQDDPSAKVHTYAGVKSKGPSNTYATNIGHRVRFANYTRNTVIGVVSKLLRLRKYAS